MAQIEIALPTKEQIEKRAYELYLARGCEPGRDFEDWLTAERELTSYRSVMKPIQAVCEKCNKIVEAKPLLSENELWLALNKGDEIEVMHLADDVHHTWKLTGQDKENLRKARAAGTV